MSKRADQHSTAATGEPEHRDAGQFSLLRTRRFLPLFLAQFCGALNDNVYRAGVMIAIALTAAEQGANPTLAANLAAGLFILPFFLFSASAGALSDQFDKARVMRAIKLAEIGIAAAATIALVSGNLWLMIAVLSLLGTQSAFFGPAKYAILPDHLTEAELVGGNAQVETGTFLAILLGTIVGGVLAISPHPSVSVGGAMLLISVLGYLAARRIPPAPPLAPPPAPAPAPTTSTDTAPLRGVPHARFSWNIVRQTANTIRLAYRDYSVFLAIMGISWFWLLGSAYLTQIPNFVVTELNGDGSVVTWLLCVFSTGIGIGSLVCERLSGHRVEIGLVPLGALGVTAAGLAIWGLELGQPTTLSWQQFAVAPTGMTLSGLLLLMGAAGGLFIVPLYAMVQARTPRATRARVIAANNIINALLMALGAVVSVALLSGAGLSIQDLFGVLAVMNAAVALFICLQVPEFLMRLIVWAISHSMYRVTHTDFHHIPEEGPAILVANHVSFVDALLLTGAVRRPLRFVMFKPIFDIPVLNFVFRTGRAIPIASRREDEDAYERAFAEIRAGLQAGDLLCIFPEGKLTTDGEIDTFRRGIERMVGETPVPVVPMALRGLWQSFFSRVEGQAFRPRGRFWSRVEILAGAPLPPSDATAAALQARVSELRGPYP